MRTSVTRFVVAVMITTFIAATLLLAPTAQARPKHWYTDAKWWAGVAVIGAAVAADYATTAQLQRQGNVETNPILGPHPSNAKLAGVGTGAFAFYVGLHAAEYHLTRDDTKPWRTASYLLMPAIVGGIHGYAAAHNEGLLRAK